MLKFMKKFGYYFLAFALILVVGVGVGLSSMGEAEEEAKETQTTSVEMISPIEGAELLKLYSDTDLLYNATLNQYESHKGVDLTSSSSNDVVAVLDGVVSKVDYTYEEGYFITITHDSGLETTYSSLAKNEEIKEGDQVKQGDKIGEISNTAADELLDGNHLHFAVRLNGKAVDPSNYITFENK